MFLQYQIFKLVDLRDPGGERGDSQRIPLKKGRSNTFDVDYGGFFSDEFARRLKVPDPRPGSGSGSSAWMSWWTADMSTRSGSSLPESRTQSGASLRSRSSR